MARLREERATLRLRDGAMRIVVVADTHGRPHPKSAALIAAERPDHILHAGDVGDLKVLDGLAKIASVSAVRGNIDAHAPELPDTLTVDVWDGDESVLKMFLLHIGVTGTEVRADVARVARAEGARVVVCGHSHVPFLGRDRDLTVFNPGSMGPRRFQLPIVFGVIEIGRQGVTMRHVDCETGQRWLPVAAGS